MEASTTEGFYQLVSGGEEELGREPNTANKGIVHQLQRYEEGSLDEKKEKKMEERKKEREMEREMEEGKGNGGKKGRWKKMEEGIW